MTTDVSLLTLNYNFFELMPINLCSDYLAENENNEGGCPADGSYDFSVTYGLPSAGEESTSWLASGWAGSGVIQIFATEDGSTLIGECTFNLKTYVTPSADKGVFQTPSAAVTVGIVLGALAVFALVCLYCYCCCRKRRRQRTSNDNKSTGGETSSFSFFRRMDDKKTVTSKSTTKGSAKGQTVLEGTDVSTVPSVYVNN